MVYRDIINISVHCDMDLFMRYNGNRINLKNMYIHINKQLSH